MTDHDLFTQAEAFDKGKRDCRTGEKFSPPLEDPQDPFSPILHAAYVEGWDSEAIQYHHYRNGWGLNPPEDSERGCWCCNVDRKKFDEKYFPFVEVHTSYSWYKSKDRKDRKVCIRVSRYDDYKGGEEGKGEIRLGECVLLDREQATQLRDQLNVLLRNME